jgi:hypothetical protein
MRRIAVPAVALALVVAGCQKDLELPPPATIGPLGVLPSFQSVAPRQTLTFAGAGGVGPYTFAFAQGGQLSGADASLDADGHYTAGSSGSAQDVIEVKDVRGVTASATVSVGARVAISPAFTGTAPGGRIAFQATGGDGTYSYALLDGPSQGSIDALTGVYTAGTAGAVTDVVVVHDGLADAFATARAEVSVGTALAAFRAETRPVAPHESVTLFAIGGKPPYRFTIASASSGSLVDPADAPTVSANLTQSTAVYVAGNRLGDPSATVVSDLVRVTDSADVPQTATLAISVGPRLTLAPLGAVYPGVPATLVASGGKPPYTFAFAARVPAAQDPTRTRGGNGGNRSGGTVNAFTGEYRPGASPGAEDWFQVTDATGAPAAVLRGPPVGGTILTIPRGLDTCIVGDVDGDQAQDALFVYKGDNGYGAQVVVGQYLSAPQPVVKSVYTTLRTLGTAFAHDLMNRHRDAFLLAGPQGYSQPFDVMDLEPDLAGNLSERQLAGGPPSAYDVNTGALWVDPAGVASANLYTDYAWGNAACNWPTGVKDPVNDRQLLRWDWAPGASGPATTPLCLAVSGGCPGCSGNYRHVVAMQLGDFNGDGVADLAYIDTAQNINYAAPSTGGRLYVAYGVGVAGAPPTSFVVGGHWGWPSAGTGGEWRFDDGGQQSESYLAVARSPVKNGGDTVLVRLVNAGGDGRVFALHDPSVGFSAPFDPSTKGLGSASIRKFVSASGVESYASVNGASGEVATFSVSGLSTTQVPTLQPGGVAATVPFSASVACFPDVNGDGIPDLVAASALGAQAQVLLGDGTNTANPTAGQSFGSRTHLRGAEFPVAVGDLDGDGFVDLAAASAGSGLDVLYGGGGMFAWGPRVADVAVNALAIADVGLGRPSIVFQDRTGAYGVVNVGAAGSFDPAVAISATTADLRPTSPMMFLLLPADLSTSAPGVDFLGIDFSSSGWFIHAILNQGVRFVDVKSPPVPAADATHPTPDQCWPVQVGVGQSALAIICAYDDQAPPPGANNRNLVTVFGSRVKSPDAAPSLDPAQAPSLAAWDPVTSVTAAPWKVPNIARQAKGSFVGMVPSARAGGPPAGTAVFLMETDQLYVVEVQLNGPPSVHGSWSVQTFAVPGISGFAPSFGVVGTLDPDPSGSAFDVVASGQSGILVLRRNAMGYPTGYHVVQMLSVTQLPVGIGRIAAGSPGDVVGVITNLGFSGATTTEIVPLLNAQDPSGAFMGRLR